MNHKSIYLADAQLNESILGIVAMIAIGTFFLIRKKVQNDDSPGSGSTTQNHLGTAVFYCLALAIFSTDTLKWISIRDNYRETIGTTTGPTDKDLINYEYYLNNRKYNSLGEKTYPFNNHFPDIEKIGGRYVVIYDSTDPELSLIDFKRRVKN